MIIRHTIRTISKTDNLLGLFLLGCSIYALQQKLAQIAYHLDGHGQFTSR